MADRVLDQVVQHDIEQPARNDRGHARRNQRRQREAGRPRRIGLALDALMHRGRHVHQLAVAQALALQPRQQHHVLDQLAHGVDLEPHLVEQGVSLAVVGGQ